MHANIVAQQRKRCVQPLDLQTKAIVAATYQHHLACHMKGCFHCSKSGKWQHVCGPNCKCCYQLPDRKRRRTEFKLHEQSCSWFKWTEEDQPRHNMEFLPKINQFDICQNVSCPAMLETNALCNTNVCPMNYSPITQYTFKYHMKSNKKDEKWKHIQP